MTDDGFGEITNWPMPKFYFQVEWDGIRAQFQEVSGMDVESQTIEYRHGDSPAFSTIKMPGIRKYGNVTMKKGIFHADDKIWAWINASKMNTIRRMTVTVRLLDEVGAVSMSWTLTNAWPVKISGVDMKAEGNEFAVESIEFAHEGISVLRG